MKLYTCYSSYTSRIYRLGTTLLLPLASALCFSLVSVYGPFSGELPMLCALVLLEPLVDHYQFGGILTKEAGGMEFLKSSERGLPYYRNVLLTDHLRRLFSFILCEAVYQLLTALLPGSWKYMTANGLVLSILLMMVCYLVSTVFLFLARLSVTFWINLFVGYGAAMTASLIMVALNLFSNVLPLWVILILLAVTAILALILARLHTGLCMKKRKESYCYDKRY